MDKDTIERLASERSKPCVTISLNTHRTKPDNKKDRIVIKNLCKNAEKRLIAEFGKKPVAKILKKLGKIPDEIDISLNLDSLHIFISDTTNEIIKSSWPARADEVHISDSFALRPLIYALNRSEEYLILLLSQGGVRLFKAVNDLIAEEVTNDDFPFGENIHFHTDPLKVSDPKAIDNMVREFLNKLDKAVVKVFNQTGLQSVVIGTEDNYSRLMQIADKKEIYQGFASINYNNTSAYFISAQAWEIMKMLHYERTSEAISEIKNSIPSGKVFTDLQEIYRASKEGRGDLLVTSYSFFQAVRMKDESTFELVEDRESYGVIEDITSVIAWGVISGNGRVFFTKDSDLHDLGKIALKVRY